MKTEHIPTPWEIDTCGWPLIINQIASDKTVCEIPLKPESSLLYVSESEQEANASFIVRACNSHDELVACLEDILDAGGDLNVMDFNRYRAALKKASAK
mgnify:CR=1 FL=1